MTLDVGRTRSLVPKEQLPRKLSGHRTNVRQKLWRVMRSASAEGIAISGTKTEEAPMRGHGPAFDMVPLDLT